jgi:hypothetical protein
MTLAGEFRAPLCERFSGLPSARGFRQLELARTLEQAIPLRFQPGHLDLTQLRLGPPE